MFSQACSLVPLHTALQADERASGEEEILGKGEEEETNREGGAAVCTESYADNPINSASSHTLVSNITRCMSKYKRLYSETKNDSLYQSQFI